VPALPPREIVETILTAFAESGSVAVLISDARAHPRRFHIISGQMSFALWVYIWTLTHGGGQARPTDEYRIQLTTVTPPLPLNPDGPTILIGFEPGLRCFAGFDLRRHQTFTPGSPSIQININALRMAIQDGFAFVRKGNEEIAVAFRPDHILSYTLNADKLHELGADARTNELLARATKLEDIPEQDIAGLAQERQRIVATVSRLARDSDFRRKVLVAYDRKCAVTGLQLRLIDAAHILPVGADESSDDVTNGLCLSPTYHRAYDTGLIYLTEDYQMRMNPEMISELIGLRLHGGLDHFKSFLERRILLPADRKQWPLPAFIRKANQIRMI
jgi:putative restriction endonuclease